ncbi:MAG: primase-helicase family protein [Desulfococcaceae bacterium]
MTDENARPDPDEECHPDGDCIPEDFNRYKREMEEMNKHHAVVNVGADTVVLNEFFDPLKDRYDVNFATFGAFRNRYLNRRVVNPWRGPSARKTRDAGGLWLESMFRREYDRVVFDPTGKCGPKYYNLFRGFAMRPSPQGDWDMLREHILGIVCRDDENLYAYVMGWMARLLQDPGGNRPGTALVMKGIQGCGKGTVANALGRIIGTHYRHILQPVHLTGRFNTHLKDALLVFCDEVTWGGDKSAEGILKGLVTEPTITIEAKGKDTLEVDSHVNVIIASNNDWIIPAGLEERRFCVLDCAPDVAGDRPYFDSLYRQLENGGYARMMYDLLRWDYSGVDLRTIPRTRGLFDQILESMTPVHKFWFQILEDGRLLEGEEVWTGPLGVKTDALYSAFLEFADRIGETRYRPIPSRFGRMLKQLCPEMERFRPREGGGNQVPHYAFPDLEQCRELFQKAIGIVIDWNE